MTLSRTSHAVVEIPESTVTYGVPGMFTVGYQVFEKSGEFQQAFLKTTHGDSCRIQASFQKNGGELSAFWLPLPCWVNDCLWDWAGPIPEWAGMWHDSPIPGSVGGLTEGWSSQWQQAWGRDWGPARFVVSSGPGWYCSCFLSWQQWKVLVPEAAQGNLLSHFSLA